MWTCVAPDCALAAWLGSGSLAHSWGAWECSFSFQEGGDLGTQF